MNHIELIKARSATLEELQDVMQAKPLDLDVFFQTFEADSKACAAVYEALKAHPQEDK